MLFQKQYRKLQSNKMHLKTQSKLSSLFITVWAFSFINLKISKSPPSLSNKKKTCKRLIDVLICFELFNTRHPRIMCYTIIFQYKKKKTKTKIISNVRIFFFFFAFCNRRESLAMRFGYISKR